MQEQNNTGAYNAGERDEEILTLHRQLAAEKLRADQGWQRYESKNREVNHLRERMEAAGERKLTELRNIREVTRPSDMGLHISFLSSRSCSAFHQQLQSAIESELANAAPRPLTKRQIIEGANVNGIDTDTDGDIFGSTNGALLKFADWVIANAAPAGDRDQPKAQSAKAYNPSSEVFAYAAELTRRDLQGAVDIMKEQALVPRQYTDEQLAAGVAQYRAVNAPHISPESLCGAIYDGMVAAAPVPPVAAPAEKHDVLTIPAAIMNLPCKAGRTIAMNGASLQAYKEGHRDARHAAADLVLARADELAALAAPADVKHGSVPTIEITLRQAEALVDFFGGHDAEVSIMERPAAWADQPQGLYAYCTDYPDEGSQYLGPTEVDDDLAMNGRPKSAPADQVRDQALAENADKKTLQAIDSLLRGQVNDPDPVQPVFPGSHGTSTTYGLAAGLLREVKKLREAPNAKPVAKYCGVELSRYTIEWLNGPLPEDTVFYTYHTTETKGQK